MHFSEFIHIINCRKKVTKLILIIIISLHILMYYTTRFL
jgi:hypothetical protein